MGIEIKGTKEGFIINVDENLSFLEIREKLLAKFDESGDFFKKTKFIKFNAPSLKKSDSNYLKQLLSETYDIIFIENDGAQKTVSIKNSLSSTLLREKLSSIDETISKIKNLTKNVEKEKVENLLETKELPTKFIFENLRSGSEIEYAGNVVVFGDVNPGAKITAEGNIIIMGSFRGMAHAGKDSQEDCFLSALRLLPLQIRIKDIFAVPPEDAKIIQNALVKIKNEEIVIESF